MTGLSAVAARNSAGMIARLNRSLTVEVAFMAVFIGLAFRSVVVGLASILPGGPPGFMITYISFNGLLGRSTRCALSKILPS